MICTYIERFNKKKRKKKEKKKGTFILQTESQNTDVNTGIKSLKPHNKFLQYMYTICYVTLQFDI